jgi:hypothetical protein
MQAHAVGEDDGVCMQSIDRHVLNLISAGPLLQSGPEKGRIILDFSKGQITKITREK